MAGQFPAHNGRTSRKDQVDHCQVPRIPEIYREIRPPRSCLTELHESSAHLIIRQISQGRPSLRHEQGVPGMGAAFRTVFLIRQDLRSHPSGNLVIVAFVVRIDCISHLACSLFKPCPSDGQNPLPIPASDALPGQKQELRCPERQDACQFPPEVHRKEVIPG